MCYNCSAIKSYAKGISESMKKGMRVAALVLVCILLLSMGASAMAAEYSRYSQAKAAVQGRDYVLPDDAKAVFLDVAAHRIICHGYQMGQENAAQEHLRQILADTPAPVEA